MPDPKLRASGTALLALAILSLAVVIFFSNSVSPKSTASSISEGIFAIFLIVGAVAWILGRLSRASTEEGSSPRLRRWGYGLLTAGLIVSVAGDFGMAFTRLGTLARDVSQAAFTGGLYIAIAGIVIVAVRNRLQARLTPPPVSTREG